MNSSSDPKTPSILGTKIKDNKTHSFTFPISSEQNVYISSKVYPNNSTENFLTADLLEGFNTRSKREKIWILNMTLRVLKEFIGDDFNGCITFIEKHSRCEDEILEDLIYCKSFYFGENHYHPTIPNLQPYKVKQTSTETYFYIENHYSVPSFKNLSFLLLDNVSQLAPAETTIPSLELATQLAHQKPLSQTYNCSALLIPLDKIEDSACLTAAIFTSKKENTMACDMSTFFYDVLKKILNTIIGVENEIVKKYKTHPAENLRAVVEKVEEEELSLIILKILNGASQKIFINASNDELNLSTDQPVTKTENDPMNVTNKFINENKSSDPHLADRTISRSVIEVTDDKNEDQEISPSSKSKTNKTTSSKNRQGSQNYISLLVKNFLGYFPQLLKLHKQTLLLFKKIYHDLYTLQEGFKGDSFLEKPDALYLSVQYLHQYARDEDNIGTRRSKAWELTQKYLALDRMGTLDYEITQYAKANSSSEVAVKLFETAKSYFTGISNFSFFSCSLTDTSATTSNSTTHQSERKHTLGKEAK